MAFIVHVEIVSGQVEVGAALMLQFAHDVEAIDERNPRFARDVGNPCLKTAFLWRKRPSFWCVV